ncbi:hypothetical protein CDAR_174541 [Caerostris darwini]|uniref:Uncharacterized protein n=1 Tax=Caerostris darwini TaxID=1538125 RepID=A0AAV4PEC8_9ARAC|nr:hypothetical protein CDAR_174541 [Caerostris darwini]
MGQIKKQPKADAHFSFPLIMLLKMHHQHQSIDSESFQNIAFFDSRLKREDLSETAAIETKSSLNRRVGGNECWEFTAAQCLIW